MIPEINQNASQKAIEELMDRHDAPIVQVLTPHGAQFSVHVNRLIQEFMRGHIAFIESNCSVDAICTVGAIRYAALKYLITRGEHRACGPFESFPWDGLAESLKGRAFFVYRGIMVIREEGPDTFDNKFRFV